MAHSGRFRKPVDGKILMGTRNRTDFEKAGVKLVNPFTEG